MQKHFYRVAAIAAMLVLGNITGIDCGVSSQAEAAKAEKKVQRFGSVIGLKPEKKDYYVKLHAETWPSVLKQIRKAKIRNYSIYLRKLDDGEHYLFSYFEYVGDDFEADMATMSADKTTQEWWSHCKPCQVPLADRAEGEWWASMEEVFHCE